MTTHADQYEGVADSYDQTFKLLPSREHVEAFSLYRLLGDLSGRSVLDLACGTGIFTRAIHRWGAARVVGVDISEDMVRVARAHEADAPLGLEYVVGDAAALDAIGQFDCVVGIFLLGYANSRDMLVQMGKSAARNLRPGGRFIAEIAHPDLSRTPGYYRKYGIEFFIHDDVEDGDEMYFSLVVGNTVTPRLTGFYWTLGAVASAMEEAGFSELRWVTPELSEQGRTQHGDAFWDDYMRKLPGIFLECTRP